MLGYTSMLTVARLLERDDFAKRYSEGRPISLMEFMYPLMQGLDSVFVHSDVEIGGTDQTYNNLVGRTLQAQLDQPAQVVVTVPLLRGTDGGDKMGKSLGNFIAIREAPSEQYGKVLSISDDLVMHYAELCCAWTRAELAACEAELADDPFSAKRRVAARIVALYHGAGRPAMPPSTSIGALLPRVGHRVVISPRTRCRRPTAPSPSSTCSPPPASPPRSPTPDGFSPAAVCASTG